jgi:transmembrane sensor
MATNDRERAENAAALWIARRGTSDWDTAAFEAWLARSSSHRVAYYRLNAAWEETGRLAALRTPPGRLVDESRPAHLRSARRWTRPRLVALAASFVLVIVAAAVTLVVKELSEPARFATRIGALEIVPLEDGSRVTLNTNSVVRVSLNRRERLINLDHGEVYFEVAHDTKRPFIVHAGGQQIVAVGTQFSVRHDAPNTDIQIIVTQGTVRLEPTVLLPAGSIAMVHADSVTVRHATPSDLEQRLSWRAGELTFRDTPLSEAVAEFNRYNPRRIVIQDPSIADLKLGGVFRSTNQAAFIDLLTQGFPVRANPESDRIVLSHN